MRAFTQPSERKGMNDKFDELAKNMAQSVTRRGALKKFGVGLACMALGLLGVARGSHAGGGYGNCNHCVAPYGCNVQVQACLNWCVTKCLHGPKGGTL